MKNNSKSAFALEQGVIGQLTGTCDFLIICKNGVIKLSKKAKITKK